MMVTPQVIESQGEGFLAACQPYRPILDGVEFTQPPLEFFQSYDWDTDKKFLIGFTEEETAGIKLSGRTSRNSYMVSQILFTLHSYIELNS